MYIKQIYTSCLAQASYYIESNNEAIIIDPIRDFEPYMELLQDRNATLKYIFETHFHADFVSGHLELAKLTNAEIVFGPNATTTYQCIIASNGQEFSLGDLIFKVLHTPGHTMESTCYLLLSNQNKEEAVFTGDTLFIGEVGRPDLAVNPKLTRQDLAGHLYDSLHNVLMNLPDHTIVYPAHGAGSACGKNISSDRQSTIGKQKQYNYALQKMTKKEFVSIVLDGISDAPDYFSHDVKMNREGYRTVVTVLEKSLQKLDAKDLIAKLKGGAIILDVRMPNDFEKGFIPGSINIGKTGMFAPWVGALIPHNIELIIVCAIDEEREIISRLARIGYEKVVGYLHLDSKEKDLFNNISFDIVKSINPSEIDEYKNNNFKILDVRKIPELELGFVDDSVHIPLSQLHLNLSKLNNNDKYLVYCAGGYRSMIACSILKSKGYQNVINIYGGFTAIMQNAY
ncbi:MAG: MBL fold metallo-hydrolase [Flavobacteriales bacterium]|nr:MBL fold metallo-hydrolase [Flavobacteriales bacterium]|tara:strand:- start:4081 stop:5445 length:1365 start_codon:yes stop_codon:yes gene_type:complete